MKKSRFCAHVLLGAPRSARVSSARDSPLGSPTLLYRPTNPHCRNPQFAGTATGTLSSFEEVPPRATGSSFCTVEGSDVESSLSTL